MSGVSLNRRINEHYFRQIQTSDLGAVLLQDLTREALREGLLFYLLLHLEWNCLDATNMSTWQPQPVHAFRLSLFPVSYCGPLRAAWLFPKTPAKTLYAIPASGANYYCTTKTYQRHKSVVKEWQCMRSPSNKARTGGGRGEEHRKNRRSM